MGGLGRETKELRIQRLCELFKTYRSLLIVTVDNVSSSQMQAVRKDLRGIAVILLGKNTLIRRAIRNFLSEMPELEVILSHVKGNIGFVFTNANLKEIRDRIESHVVSAPAKAGAIAPIDVYVPAGPTGFDPGKTSFFQALSIPTKITRGTIEITKDIHLVQKESKVGQSEATLLNMLNISPFTYGLKVLTIYDSGNVFESSVLDVTEDYLRSKFMEASRQIACISLALNYPTLVSVPHVLVNKFKDLMALSVATEYPMSYTEQAKAYLADPSAFAAAAAASQPAESNTASGDAGAAEAKKEEEAEESDDDMGFGLFD